VWGRAPPKMVFVHFELERTQA